MNGWRVEYHLGMQRAGEWIFKDPPRPDGDVVRIPPAPGLGMEVDRDRLRESRLD
jgi:L-alanine-DL-glutamate epimerase-like enolase superfamily enzyme